jgi:hypothetical protein
MIVTGERLRAIVSVATAKLAGRKGPQTRFR